MGRPKPGNDCSKAVRRPGGHVAHHGRHQDVGQVIEFELHPIEVGEQRGLPVWSASPGWQTMCTLCSDG